MKRIKVSGSIKAELQKEIGSRCPFCPSEDVGHFEFHHIDGNRNNTVSENLLMLCRQCHSKFTKGHWAVDEAQLKKHALLSDITWKLFHSSIEFDYTCYNMQQANGRLPEESGNGSVMNVNVVDRYHFILTLKESNGRIWIGELVLQQKDYGTLLFRYQGSNEFEFGRRECYLKQIFSDKIRDDIIYIKPLTDLKDYGNELVKRRVLLY
jgi:hypothetical protein